MLITSNLGAITYIGQALKKVFVKRIIYLVSILVFFIGNVAYAQFSVGKQGNTVFYLVRHAEKDTGSDPVLTKAGYQRAGDLYRALNNIKIQKIFISQYRRSRLTADSLIVYNGTDTVHYLADASGDGLFSKLGLLTSNADAVLIIGHSNTIPGIIRRLGVTGFQIKEISDYEYDNLYIVKPGRQKRRLIQKKFGKASIPANRTTMKPLE